MLREKILGCWLGKAVGGTLGQTVEGLEGPLSLTYYSPVPTGMVPNDDLDLQVVFAHVLAQQDVPSVDRHTLAASWVRHVEFPWNEYGVGLRNYAEGIEPPYSGSFDNWWSCGEGAAIRSELWACLAPGAPDVAGAYAYEDACFDHAGDGIQAEVFLSRLQSLAFYESDPDKLLDGALAGIATDSELHHAIQDTRQWVAEGHHWTVVRERIMDRYGRDDFTDVRPNTAFVVLGWLAGTTFSERILICANCGEDTDSSTASLGALLGIIDPDSIEERWLTPIGRDLILSKEIVGIDAPATIDGFTDLVMDLSERLANRMPEPREVSFDPADHAIPVELAWANTHDGKWAIRDVSELPHLGAPPPENRTEFVAATVPGTWVRWPRSEFQDSILLISYRFDAQGRNDVRLMMNCSEHFRVWLDGEFLFGAQGTQRMFPAPDKAPAGHSIDFEPTPGIHELLVAVKRPPVHREEAEWVLSLAERPSYMWIANAFRPE